MKDFYKENDLMERAISEALRKYSDIETDLQLKQAMEKSEEEIEAILYDIRTRQEIEKTDRLHEQSVNSAILGGLKVLS